MSAVTFTLAELQIKADSWYKLTSTEQLEVIDWLKINPKACSQVIWNFGQNNSILIARIEPFYYWNFKWTINREALYKLSPGTRRRIEDILSHICQGINEGNTFDDLRRFFPYEDNWEKLALEVINIIISLLQTPENEDTATIVVAWTPVMNWNSKIEAVRVVRIVQSSMLR